MPYYFDNWGWLTNDVLPERSTSVQPPAPADIPQGHAANFTGHYWIVLPYIAPSTAPAVPRSVTRRQMRLALHRNGLLSGIEAYVAAQNDTELTIWWQDSNEFERTNAVMNQHLPAVGMSSADADNLFVYAGGL